MGGLAMKHYLHVGHFVRTKAIEGVIALERPLDVVVLNRLLSEIAERDINGSWSFDGERVLIKQGYLICPFLSAGVNRRSLQFIDRLFEATGCLIVWLEHGTIHTPESLRREIPGGE
jgi:hypothetical protein